jgi:hypothetical protein
MKTSGEFARKKASNMASNTAIRLPPFFGNQTFYIIGEKINNRYGLNRVPISGK